MEGAHDGALRGYCNVREQVLHPSPPPFLPHTSPSSPFFPPVSHTFSSDGAMISLSSSKVESPRNATLSVMMKAKAQRSSRRDSSLECTLPAGGGGGGREGSAEFRLLFGAG